jgi:hypothetical protein
MLLFACAAPCLAVGSLSFSLQFHQQASKQASNGVSLLKLSLSLQLALGTCSDHLLDADAYHGVVQEDDNGDGDDDSDSLHVLGAGRSK